MQNEKNLFVYRGINFRLLSLIIKNIGLFIIIKFLYYKESNLVFNFESFILMNLNIEVRKYDPLRS